MFETPEELSALSPSDARYVEFVAASMYSYAFSRERFESLCGATSER